jgi:hypothetical protein
MNNIVQFPDIRAQKRDRAEQLSRGCDFLLDAISEMKRADLDQETIFWSFIHVARAIKPISDGAA